jgi:hypothetical protein
MNKTVYSVVLCALFCIQNLKGQTTINPGSFIINMGISTQTVNNGLRPYGMVYDLIRNHNVPVLWVINASKSKDGQDFFYRDTSYRGGTFIIPSQYINSTVRARITHWRGRGVVGRYMISSLTTNVTHTLINFPRWTLNNANRSISEDFFALAEIPSSAYDFSTPGSLGACNDLFVMPHADPTWSTHGNLYNWNRNTRGSIWAGCHAVSVLENTINPGNTAQQMNFLSNRGLIDYNTHNNNGISNQPLKYLFNQSNYNGSPISASAADPVFQMIGAEDNAHANGSERVYIPVNSTGSGWRNTTKIGAYDSSHANVSSNPHGPAAMTLYGRAFGRDTFGYVMYQSGHNIGDDTDPNNVAAVRQFFNFSFVTAMDKAPTINSFSITSSIGNNQNYSLSISSSSPVRATLTYQWTSTFGGSFSNPTSASTTYTAPSSFSSITGTITCVVTDQCGRKVFIAQPVNAIVLLPIKLANFEVKSLNQSVELKWSTYSSENLAKTEIYRSNDGFSFVKINSIEYNNNVEIKNNQFIDENAILLNNDKLYYKLKFVTLNEESTWSPSKFLLNKTSNHLITLYPNPSDQMIHINAPFEIEKTQIIDMFGRVLLEETFNSSIDVSFIPNGNYILRITSKEGLTTKNIIIQH